MDRTTAAVLAEITAAVAEVRDVARAQDDTSRTRAADWLDGLFAGVTTHRDLRAAAAEALGLWGGAGSFSDVGSAEADHAVGRLYRALRAGRSWLLRAG
ncbi:hypothetical protein C5C24_14040 [Rathayibacter sp. AY2B3]|jgi:hypothetical protein|uniref:hypothetical protein n=1 Tax=unclassified Rathayibacter TaxID=2609250 RepID=UPI000CE807C9|nr:MULTISPECIES: hypothetical protein [unclassified Rathayibacter]PPG49038.1 hypothetical protein C5C24_14040 [Rathayibacter sp. AY2B3]PPI20166.1 hypothetical protein C5D08_12290 [Rathayibacter sp. AY1B6]PPI31130.1 hypothetical protein C5D34_12725 [Rathayibacter sp. AY1B1]